MTNKFKFYFEAGVLLPDKARASDAAFALSERAVSLELDRDVVDEGSGLSGVAFGSAAEVDETTVRGWISDTLAPFGGTVTSWSSDDSRSDRRADDAELDQIALEFKSLVKAGVCGSCAGAIAEQRDAQVKRWVSPCSNECRIAIARTLGAEQ